MSAQRVLDRSGYRTLTEFLDDNPGAADVLHDVMDKRPSHYRAE